MCHNRDKISPEISKTNKKINILNEELDKSKENFDKEINSLEDELKGIRLENNIKPPISLIRSNTMIEPATKLKILYKTNIPGDIRKQYEMLSTADLIVSVLSGMAGVATSWALRYEGFGARKVGDGQLVSDGGILADIHDSNYRKTNNPLLYKIQEAFKHPDNPFDKLEGAFHRLRYGHDVFNWNQQAPDGTNLWQEMLKKHGENSITPIKKVSEFLGGLNTIGRYFALYIFDSFSKEGLPLPFSSYLNVKETNELGEVVFKNRLEDLVGGRQDIYASFLTIKARDVFGVALTRTLLGSYRAIQKTRGYEIIKNHKYYEMNCIAYFVVLLGCLSISTFDLKTASMNYPALGLLIKNVVQLNMLVNKNRKIIDQEYERLLEESVKELDVGKPIDELLDDNKKGLLVYE